MDGIFQLIAGLVLRIFDLVLGKLAADRAAKERFIQFVEQMSASNSTAAKLKLKYDAQVAELKKRQAENAERAP